MVESNLSLVKSGSVTLSAKSTEWIELLKLDNDPNRKIHIRDITITLSSNIPTDTVQIKLTINGEPKLRDFAPLTSSTTLSFGGDLTFTGKTDKPPILIEVRWTAGSASAVYATCVITGVELQI